jgi:hypothetical protein
MNSGLIEIELFLIELHVLMFIQAKVTNLISATSKEAAAAAFKIENRFRRISLTFRPQMPVNLRAKTGL